MRNVARQPELAEAGGRNAVFLHQLRYDILSIRRNRRSQFFIILLPLLLLVTFAGLFGTDAVEVAGHEVAANRASVPGIMSLAVLTSSFMALVMTVVSQRQYGVLKRRRATQVPAAVLVLSRAVTATLSSVVACGLLVVVADLAFGISPESAQPIMQVALLPLQMISGVYFPMSQLPAWLEHVANAFPLAHLTNALQHAWLPSGARVAWGDLGIMALWGLAAAFVAARRFQWLPAD